MNQEKRPADYSLEGHVAVVTGAARGIGRACALRLAAAGADVVIVDRNLAGSSEYSEELSSASVMGEVEALGRRSSGYEVDLVDRDAVQEMVSDIHRQYGRIDAVVNIAGGQFSPLETTTPSTVTPQDWQATFDVNLTTLLNMSQATMPIFMDQKSGSIISTTSSAAWEITPGAVLSAYGAAKAAVIHLTRTMALELGPYGVRANCVSPGYIASSRIVAMAEKRGGMGGPSDLENVPLGRFGTPDDVARTVEFLVSPMGQYISGQVHSVCGAANLGPR